MYFEGHQRIKFVLLHSQENSQRDFTKRGLQAGINPKDPFFNTHKNFGLGVESEKQIKNVMQGKNTCKIIFEQCNCIKDSTKY